MLTTAFAANLGALDGWELLDGNYVVERYVTYFTLYACLWTLTLLFLDYLDSIVPWDKLPTQRMLTQLLGGLSITLLLHTLVIWAVGLKVLQVPQKHLVIPLANLEITLAFAVIFHLIRYIQWREPVRVRPEAPLPELEHDSTLWAQRGDAKVALDPLSVHCFVRVEGVTLAYTAEGDTLRLADALDDLQQQLPYNLFFRVGRNAIVHRHSVKSYKVDDARRLILDLHTQVSEPVRVSKHRAAAFRKWIDH